MARVVVWLLVVAVVAVVLAPFGALELIETDRARSSLRDIARDYGITLDYDRLIVRPFSGRLALEGLRVSTPEPLAHVAAEALQVRRLEVRFSPSALLEGHLHVESVEVEGVRAHLVIDEEGSDSLTLLLAGLVSGDDEPEEPSAPLSHLLAELALPLELRVDELLLTDVRVEQTELLAEGHRRMVALDGIELRGWLRQDRGPLEAELTLGSAARPEGTRFALVEHDGVEPHVREVEATLDVRATLPDASTLALGATVELIRQSFEDDLALPRQALSLALSVRFDPAEGAIRLDLTELSLLDGAARLTLGAELPDGALVPRLTGGDGTVALDALARVLPPELGALSEQGHLELRARPVDDGAAADLEVRVRAARLGVSSPVGNAGAEGLTLELDARAAPERVSATLRLSVGALRASSLAGNVEVSGAALVVDPLELASADGGEIVWDDVLAAVGRAEASLTLASVRGSSDDVTSAETSAVRVELRAPLSGEPVWSPELTVALGATRLALADGTRVEAAPLRARVTASDVTPDFARPARFSAEATSPRVQVTSAADRIVVDGLTATVSGTARSETELSAQVGVRTRSLTRTEAHSTLAVRGLDVRATLNDVVLDAADPVRSTAAVSLQTRTERIELHDEVGRVLLEGLAPSLRGSYRGAGASSFTGTLPLGPLRMAEGDRAYETVLPHGELTWSVTDLVVNHARPLRSRVTLSARGHFPHTSLELAARLADGAGEGTLHAHVAPLSAVVGAAAPEGLDLAHSVLDLRARGTWSGLDTDTPALDHHVEGSLTRTSLARPGLSLELPRVGLTLDHHGRGGDHRATARLVVDAPVIDGERLERAIVLGTEARLDLGTRLAHLETTATGPGELTMRLRADATIEADGTVRHTERLSLARFGALAGLIPTGVRDEHPLDLDRLALELEGGGNLTRFVAPDLSGLVEWDGSLHQTLTTTLTGLRYTPEGVILAAPEVRLTAEIDESPDTLTVEAQLDVPRLDFEDPTAHWTVHGTHQNLHLRSRGPLAEGRLVLAMDGNIDRVEQDVLAVYPMEDLSLVARFRMEGFESMELQRLTLLNARGGTRLELQKTLDRVGAAVEGDGGQAMRGSQHLVLTGRLEQDLARLDRAPETLRASGRVEAPFTVSSADGSLFRVSAILGLHGVAVELPELGLALRGLEASVPVEEAVEWTPEAGLAVVPHTERNPFARVRFQDVQPFLRDDSHLEIESARWGEIELGHMVGSLRVDRNVFAVNGVRIERGDALITGQLLVDYLPGEERIHFRGNVTGLRPHGTDDPLDANAAIVFDPHRLELDGRVQVVRIGGPHLLELLDMLDPYRENGSLNGVRGALEWGHPQRVSLGLSRGLMSMNVQLGGIIGSLIQIGEIRGIALGPFMSRHVAPYFSWE